MVFNPGDPVNMQELIAYLQARQAQQPQAPQTPNPIATLGKGVAKGYLKKLAKDKLLEQLASKDALPSLNNNFMYSSSTPDALSAAWNAPASGGVDMASIMNPATEQMMTPMVEGASEAVGALTSGTSEGASLASGTPTVTDPSMFAEAAPYAGAIAGAIMAQQGYEGASRNMKANHGDMSARDIAKGIYGDNMIGRAMGSLTDIPIVGKYVGSAFRPFIGSRTLAEDRRKKALEASGYKYLGDPESYNKGSHYDRWAEGQRQYQTDIKDYGSDFVGNTKDNRFINNQFFNSRDESQLKPQDIVGYSAFAEKFGNDWMEKMNEQQRLAEAQKALQNNAVREHHGTVDIDWSKIYGANNAR